MMLASSSSILFALMTGAFVLGGVQLAIFARNGDVNALIASALAYLAGNAALWHFLKTEAYGPLMIVSALAVLVANAFISAGVFGDKYSMPQAVGVVLAVLAILLVGFGGDDGAGA